MKLQNDSVVNIIIKVAVAQAAAVHEDLPADKNRMI